MAAKKGFSDGARLIKDVTVSPAEVSAQSVEEQDFTVAGVLPSQVILVVPQAAGTNGLNGCSIGAAFCVTAGTVKVQLNNPTTGAITPKASQVWRILAL